MGKLFVKFWSTMKYDLIYGDQTLTFKGFSMPLDNEKYDIKGKLSISF